MTTQQPHTAKDVERVAEKLFQIVESEIGEGHTTINPESLMARAIREAGLR